MDRTSTIAGMMVAMIELAVLIATAAVLFATTNVDDLVVLTVLSASSGARRVRRNVVAGQYIGIGVLTGVAIAAAFGLTLLPRQLIGLLGCIPLAIGVAALFKNLKHRGSGNVGFKPSPVGILGVAGITIANGADNLAVYTPLFHGLSASNILLVVVVFAILTGAWCVVAARLGRHRRSTQVIEKFGHWLLPAVFIIVGILILVRSESGYGIIF